MARATPAKSTGSQSRGGPSGNRRGGGTSRQAAKGGGQRGGGTRQGNKSKASSNRRSKPPETAGAGRGQSSVRKGESQTAATAKKDVGRRGRSNGGGTDASGESNVRGEP